MNNTKETELLNYILDIRTQLLPKLKRRMDKNKDMLCMYCHMAGIYKDEDHGCTNLNILKVESKLSKKDIKEIKFYIDFYEMEYKESKQDYDMCSKFKTTKELLDPDYVEFIKNLVFRMKNIKI